MTRRKNWFHSPLYNPYYATNEICAQLLVHHGKKMVCLAFTREQQQVMIDTIAESGMDYRLTITDGPARHYEQRIRGQVTRQYDDGLWKPRTERE